MPSAPALSARDVAVALSGKTLLENIELEADFGSITAVLGPNGAGKTTLLKTLAGLLEHRGRVELCGKRLSLLSPRERGRALALVPQRSLLTARLTVYSAVSHGRYAHHGGRLSSRDRQVIESAMARADVSGLAARELPELSYGEQRRVLLARALATEARVLLLDEPTASLDIAHALSLFSTLRALTNEGFCVVMVLHQLDDALRHTDRAVLLQRGRLAAIGPTAQVLTPQNVRDVYGVELVQGEALGFRLIETRA